MVGEKEQRNTSINKDPNNIEDGKKSQKEGETPTTSTLALPSGVSGDTKFIGIAHADDGKLYCAPCNASVVLVIEGIIPSPASSSSSAPTSTSALNDNALGIDRLGYSLYAKALHTVINTAETPCSVGLYAQWGSGKTFFIGA